MPSFKLLARGGAEPVLGSELARNDVGEVFTDEGKLTHAMGGEHLHVAEGDADTLARKFSDSLNELQLQLKSLDPVLSQAENRIREFEAVQQPLIQGLTRIMENYLEIDPVGKNREIRIFIQKLDLRLQKLRCFQFQYFAPRCIHAPPSARSAADQSGPTVSANCPQQWLPYSPSPC